MTDRGPHQNETTRRALERLDVILERRPEAGVSTDRSVTVITNGLRCSIDEGPWHLDADLSKSLGGTGAAPTPGVLGRAALGSCLALGYQLAAARLGVELDSVRVEVEADSDVSGMLVPSATIRPGYSEVRYHITIESSAPGSDVQSVIDQADRLSPYRDVFASTTPLRRTISVNRPAA